MEDTWYLVQNNASWRKPRKSSFVHSRRKRNFGSTPRARHCTDRARTSTIAVSGRPSSVDALMMAFLRKKTMRVRRDISENVPHVQIWLYIYDDDEVLCQSSKSIFESRFWVIFEFAGANVHLSVRGFLVMPHLACLYRPCRGRPRPCSRRSPAGRTVLVFLHILSSGVSSVCSSV